MRSPKVMSTPPLIRTLSDHWLSVAIVSIGPVTSTVVACVLYRPHFAYSISLICGLAYSLIVVDALKKRVITDNAGTTKQSSQPMKFWFRFALWSLAYCFATFWPIGFAVQEASK